MPNSTGNQRQLATGATSQQERTWGSFAEIRENYAEAFFGGTVGGGLWDRFSPMAVIVIVRGHPRESVTIFNRESNDISEHSVINRSSSHPHANGLTANEADSKLRIPLDAARSSD